MLTKEVLFTVALTVAGVVLAQYGLKKAGLLQA